MMKNFQNIMKQAKEMQAKMEEVQAELAVMEIEGQAGAGMIKVMVNGKGEVKSISINPELVKVNEVEVLEDLLIAAINDAKTKADAISAEKMAKVTSGMPLPGGMKLPF